jgi:nucleoside-diphosphate-sugar epimerase
MSKILITGGAGLIGSHTARTLLGAGHDVAVYDFLYQYIYPVRPTYMENMQYRFDVLLRGAEIMRGSIENKDKLRREVTRIKPDYVIHLAALPLADIALSATEEAFASIVQGTVNILEMLRDLQSVRKLVYVSSSMVYGDFRQTPLPEDTSKEPKEIYGGMKLASEILVKVFSQRYGLSYAIVRPSAVYGPTDNNRRVLHKFVESAAQDESIVVNNPDTTFLDFTYVEDVAQGLAKVTLSPDVVNDDFNITFGQGRSLAEAITVLRRHFPNLRVHENTEGDSFRPARGTLDISKARRLVGYKPQYPLEAGLARYVDHVRSHNRVLTRTLVMSNSIP